MIRLETETGWWLITHPDHARLAGEFAAAWGNDEFLAPEPRDRTLLGIRAHDDGWLARDAHPQITRQGKPSAFSVELVGKYSAFEEIDLADYLAVREEAVGLIARRDAYAGILVSMHTYNLLTERADRATIRAEQLTMLDVFLDRQRELQAALLSAIEGDASLHVHEKRAATLLDHFRLLQASDNLSLLSCVDYAQAADLLHPLRRKDGSAVPIRTIHIGERHFRLDPWPFHEARLSFSLPARHVTGKTFASAGELEAAYIAAPAALLKVTLSA